MNHFDYKNGQLYAEAVKLADIAANLGTPCYVYSRATLERHWHAFNDVFADVEHLVCYAVKANSSLAVLNLFARLGSGFDIVSVGELERVLRAGGEPKKIVFSGVGKTAAEMRRALEVGILCFNIESRAELDQLNAVAAELNTVASISIRVNPDVDANTHPYISTGLKENKFGINIHEAEAVYQYAAGLPQLNIVGIDCHIGSQLSQIAPFVDALKRLLVLVDKLEQQGIHIKHIDVGGGLGITYDDEKPPLPAEYAQAILAELRGQGKTIIIEPGRAIAGNAGLLLTQVMYLKLASRKDRDDSGEKNFAIVDAAMNDLIRPSLYKAWQKIIPLTEPAGGPGRRYDIVGPICETGDFLGKDRQLDIKQGDILAVCSAGAYGFTMSSNYNTRPRAAEVMVDGDRYHVIREREKLQDLWRGESILPE